MPYSNVHLLIAWGGTLPGGEAWSNSLRASPDFAEPSGFADAQDRAEDVAAAINTWWANTNNPSANPATLTFVKCNAITTAGKYALDQTAQVLYTTPVVAGGSAAGRLPNQISLVASLLTDADRGLAARGRIFLPLPKFGVGVSGQIDATAATQAATAVAGLISSLNAISGVGQVGIYSNVREGATRPVTRVSVGRVYDTMRSRRTSMNEEAPAPVAVVGGT